MTEIETGVALAVTGNGNGLGAMELLAQLERSGSLTPVSLMLPPDISFPRYEALLRLLGGVHEGARWHLGDAINQGDNIFGETYTQAIAATGLAEQTLINYASVCRYVPRALRRTGLSFSHHAEVAYLQGSDQKRLLDLAEQNRWRRSDLRSAASAVRERPPRIELSTSSPGNPESDDDSPTVVCQCVTCGRFHHADRDVIDPNSINA